MKKEVVNKFIKMLENEVKPALGCTEPVSVALAVAKSVQTLGQKPETVEVKASGNILKNGMGVGIPGTGMVGLSIAAALGALIGDADAELEVLKNVNKQAIEDAKLLVEQKKISIAMKDTSQKLYIEAISVAGENYSKAVIAKDHTNFVLIEKNGTTIFSKTNRTNRNTKNTDKISNTSIEEIFDFAVNVNLNKIKNRIQFIIDGAKLNIAIAQEGLLGEYGLMVGKTLAENVKKCVLQNDIATYAMSNAAAASDARMAGSTMTVLSNSGSGNQGITVSVPITSVAEKLNIFDDRVTRALLLGNLIAIHLRTFMDKLSAFCGAVSAATGASSGITYLLDGTEDNIKHAINNMVANISGMICDGAKAGCALKVSTAVNAAVQSALLAVNDRGVSEYDGIIEKDIEKTIKNLAIIASEGMAHTDRLILDIMSCK